MRKEKVKDTRIFFVGLGMGVSWLKTEPLSFEQFARITPDPEEIFVPSQERRAGVETNIGIHASLSHPRRQCFCAETERGCAVLISCTNPNGRIKVICVHQVRNETLSPAIAPRPANVHSKRPDLGKSKSMRSSGSS